MAAVPYHLLKVCGSIVFAARGSDIYSFNLALEHISTWKYPVKHENGSSAVEAHESPAPDGPPTKRRKLEDGQEPGSNGQGKSKNKSQNGSNPHIEAPFVQGLYTTTDGRYLVAITDSDKTIWVFEHDGVGNLKQLSKRTMPKRPCALALTKDDKTILSADKFGDVYALPLIPSSDPTPLSSATATPSRASSTPAPPSKPQANELTVHTKRNLRALENQKKSLTRQQQQQQQQQQESRPQFEHTLLLGHVSMLTAIAVATSTVTTNGDSATGAAPAPRTREYILTGDRDEHIRVSRGFPSGQTHVIEGFCLGHEDFVSRLCVAPAGGGKNEDILISGGGDDDLFVWDWVNGKLLGRAGLLERVKAVEGMEGASKLAVTRLAAWRWEGVGTVVVVVCERVPALFIYELLDDNTFRHRETIEMPANPLDVECLESPCGSPSPRLLVAVDNSASAEGDASSPLIMLDKDAGAEAGWRQTKVQNLPAPGETNMSVEELQKILYTTESLRKLTDFE